MQFKIFILTASRYLILFKFFYCDSERESDEGKFCLVVSRRRYEMGREWGRKEGGRAPSRWTQSNTEYGQIRGR